MQTRLLYLFTRTPLHVGAGSSVGAIDQPIVRERHTGFPIIPGSSLKGVLADAHGATSSPTADRSDVNRRLFGSTRANDNQAFAGSISFGEGKLLLFTVRTTQGCFAWITCPLVLSRWGSARNQTALQVPNFAPQEVLADATTVALGQKAVFEDSVVTVASAVPAPVIEAVTEIFKEDGIWGQSAER